MQRSRGGVQRRAARGVRGELAQAAQPGPGQPPARLRRGGRGAPELGRARRGAAARPPALACSGRPDGRRPGAHGAAEQLAQCGDLPGLRGRVQRRLAGRVARQRVGARLKQRAWARGRAGVRQQAWGRRQERLMQGCTIIGSTGLRLLPAAQAPGRHILKRAQKQREDDLSALEAGSTQHHARNRARPRMDTIAGPCCTEAAAHICCAFAASLAGLAQFWA